MNIRVYCVVFFSVFFVVFRIFSICKLEDCQISKGLIGSCMGEMGSERGKTGKRNGNRHAAD